MRPGQPVCSSTATDGDRRGRLAVATAAGNSGRRRRGRGWKAGRPRAVAGAARRGVRGKSGRQRRGAAVAARMQGQAAA
eukprot:10102539-Alexandrium_andersonii.AAC.1